MTFFIKKYESTIEAPVFVKWVTILCCNITTHDSTVYFLFYSGNQLSIIFRALDDCIFPISLQVMKNNSV